MSGVNRTHQRFPLCKRERALGYNVYQLLVPAHVTNGNGRDYTDSLKQPIQVNFFFQNTVPQFVKHVNCTIFHNAPFCATPTFVPAHPNTLARMAALRICTENNHKLILKLANILQTMRPERSPGGNLPLYHQQNNLGDRLL